MNQISKEALQEEVAKRLQKGRSLFVAIDGPCATGKTTMAGELAHTVVSMDDFFLTAEQRTEDIAGNIDKERLLSQVLVPLSQGKEARYRPYHCHLGQWGEEIALNPASLVVVEGVYSLLPIFRPYFQLKLFLEASWEVRRERLLLRGGAELLARFEEEWIPRENRYFQTHQVKQHCDFVLET